MIRWFLTILGRLGKWGKAAPDPADRSRLVGMYLSHTNHGSRGIGGSAAEQQRHNGKFSQNRRRGG